MKRAEDVSGAVNQNELFAFRGHQSKLSDTVLKSKASQKQIENFERCQIIVLTVTLGVFN
jgi:hypothetical protein